MSIICNTKVSTHEHADQASLVTTWIVSLLKLLAMAVGCVNQANAPHKKHDALLLSIQLSVLEDCYVGCDKCFSLDTERVTTMVLQAVSLSLVCPVKTVWPLCDFVLQR